MAPSRLRPVLVSALVLIPLMAAPVSALPAKSGKQSVSGTLTWTVTTTKTEASDPADPFRSVQTATQREEHRLRINAVRDPKYTRTYVFKRATGTYDYSLTETRVTEDYDDGQVRCTTTTQVNVGGNGSTPTSVSIFGKYNPRRDVRAIDQRTRGISVQAVLPGSGTSTTTIRGAGLSPCQSGSYTDPVDVSGSTRPSDSRAYCIPSGLKPSSSLAPLFGTWNNAKKRFDFRCTNTYRVADEVVEISVSGSLKYRR